MHATASPFISSVSDEFASYRDVLVKELEYPGVRVETQERLAQLPGGESMKKQGMGLRTLMVECLMSQIFRSR